MSRYIYHKDNICTVCGASPARIEYITLERYGKVNDGEGLTLACVRCWEFHEKKEW